MNRTTLPPIDSLARARRNYAAAIAVALTITTGLLILAALAGIDLLWPIGQDVRIILATGGIVLFVTWILFPSRQRWQRSTPHAAARAMEAARPEFGQQFRTALEVAERSAVASPEEEFFAEHLIAEARAALNRVSWSGLIPRMRLVACLGAGSVVAAALVLSATQWPEFRFALTRFLLPGLPNTYTGLAWTVAPKSFDDRHPPRFELRIERRLAEPVLYVREYGGEWVRTSMTALPDGRTWDIVLTGRTADLEMYAEAGDARTKTLDVKFEPIAKLTATRVHLEYPEYTGLPPADREKGDVSVVEDTHVSWQFTFNVVPKRLEWRIGSETPQELTVDGATKSVSVDWTAGASHENAVISVLDASGEAIDSWHFIAEGFADALPKVEILEPGQDREATSVSEIPVRIRAKDDFGISEIGLILEAAGEREWVLEKVIPDRRQREVTEIATVSLEKIPLTLRDNVRIYAYALDHKARGGPRAVSALRSIDIRQFKKRWMFMEAGGMLNIPKISKSLAQLGQLISKQRGIVSDTFLLRESTRSVGAAVTSSARPIAQRESAAAEEADQIHEQWLDAGAVPRDDITLLDTAGMQMNEAADSLGLKAQANLDVGFRTADRALSTLLQLRKALITLLMKAQGAEDGQKSEEQMRALADLAREAERLAHEEHDVRGQLAPEVAAGTNIEATRRQQEIVVNDGGELYAALVDHPQSIEGAIRLMGEAEKAYRDADQTLHGSKPTDATSALETAEQRLLDVAKFLRAMELNNVSETLAMLARDAEKDAQATQNPSESKNPSPGASGSGKPSASKDSKDSKDSPSTDGQEKTAKSDPAKDGQSNPDGKPQTAQEKAKQSAEQAARDTTLADEILAGLAEKAGQTKQAADSEAPPSDFNQTLGQRLAELREKIGAGKLAEELDKLAKSPSPDAAEDGKARSDAAGKLDAMAGNFRDAAKTIDAARSALLALAQAQADQLKKQLGGADPKGENKADGSDGKDGDKGKAKGKGKGDGKQPGKDGAGKNGEGKDGAGEKAGEQPGKGGGDKPGDQRMANNSQAEQKNGAKGGGNRPNGQAKGNASDAGADEKPPGDTKANGSGGISGNTDKAKEGPGGQAMGRFAQTLRDIGDNRLHELSIRLLNNGSFSRDAIPTIDEAVERIGELLSALPAANAPIAASGAPPEARRREVEDYFRNLSDDFAGEQKGDSLPPGQTSP